MFYIFFQDSQLEEDIISIDLNSIPTQTFSSSICGNHGPTDDAILKILSTPPQHRTLVPIPQNIFLLHKNQVNDNFYLFRKQNIII